MLLRRADTVAVIGRALTAKASGLGARPVAVVLDRPLGTVRGWLRRFAGKAEQVRAWFTGLLVAVAADPVVPEAAAAVFADAVAAIEAVAWAVAGRLHPAEDGDVVNLDAPLDQQFLDVAVRQVVSQVETDGDHDDGRWEPDPANVDRGGWAGRRRFECFTVQACLTTASINATDPVSVTVSIGVAELGPDDDLDGLLHRADEALYQAKAAGRNRVNAA